MSFLFQNEDSGVLVGGKRTNKTRHLVRMILSAHNEGYDIVTNLTLVDIPYKKLNSKDPEKFLNELDFFCRDRFENKKFNRVFLAIDEFPNIIHAQDHKKGTPWARVFNQLGKCGITTYATSPTFKQIYNGFRENANKRIICKKITDDDYYIIIQKQDDIDFELYRTIAKMVFNGSEMNNYYNFREEMYL